MEENEGAGAAGALGSGEAGAVEAPKSFEERVKAAEAQYDADPAPVAEDPAGAGDGSEDPAAAAAAVPAAGAESAGAEAQKAEAAPALDADTAALLKELQAEGLTPAQAASRLSEAREEAFIIQKLEPELSRLEAEVAAGRMTLEEAEAAYLQRFDAEKTGAKESAEVAQLRAELASYKEKEAAANQAAEVSALIASSPEKALFEAAGDAARDMALSMVKASGVALPDAVKAVAGILRSVAGDAVLGAAKERLAAGAAVTRVPPGSTGAGPDGSPPGRERTFAERVSAAKY